MQRELHRVFVVPFRAERDAEARHVLRLKSRRRGEEVAHAAQQQRAAGQEHNGQGDIHADENAQRRGTRGDDAASLRAHGPSARAQRGNPSNQHAGEERDGDTRRDDGGIDREIHRPRQELRGMRAQPTDSGDGDSEAEERGERCLDQRFGDEHRREPRGRRAERLPHDDFFLADEQLRQAQPRGIRHRREQHHHRDREHDPERRRHLPSDDHVVQRLDGDVALRRVIVGIRLAQAGGERLRLARGLIDRHAVAQTRERAQMAAAAACGSVVRVVTQRDPRIGRLAAPLRFQDAHARRHHADHFHRDVADAQHAADDAAVAAVAALPQLIAEDDANRAAANVVVGVEVASQLRFHAEDAEGVVSDAQQRDLFGTAAEERRAAVRDRGDVRERSQRRLPIGVRREADVRRMPIVFSFADAHQPLGIRERQRREEHAAHRADDARRRAESEGQRENHEKLPRRMALHAAEKSRRHHGARPSQPVCLG